MRSAVMCVIGVAALAGSGCSGDVDPQPAPTASSLTTSVEPETPGDWSRVFNDVGPSVVRISVVTCDDGGVTGSGFAVADDVVVTAAHVAAGARTVSVQTEGGDTVEAEPVAIVPEADLAVLRLLQPLDAAPLSFASAVPERGSELAVLGYPLSTWDLRIVDGIVVGLPEPVDYGDQQVDRAFITNAATNGGNSGGPVVDRSGQVIGLLSGGQNWDDNDVPVEGVNFVVPVEDISDKVDLLLDATESRVVPCDEDVEPEPAEPGEDEGILFSVQDESDVGYAVGQLLYTHGLAINDGSYEAAFEVFTPAAQENLGGLAEWSAGVEESYWRGIEVLEAQWSESDERGTARVALRTEQPPDGEVTECSAWILTYEVALVDGEMLINKAKGDPPTPC